MQYYMHILFKESRKNLRKKCQCLPPPPPPILLNINALQRIVSSGVISYVWIS
jgi:hypothetical protein